MIINSDLQNGMFLWSAIFFKIVIVVDPFFSYVSFTLEMDRFCYVLAVNGKWKFWSFKYLIVHFCGTQVLRNVCQFFSDECPNSTLTFRNHLFSKTKYNIEEKWWCFIIIIDGSFYSNFLQLKNIWFILFYGKITAKRFRNRLIQKKGFCKFWD